VIEKHQTLVNNFLLSIIYIYTIYRVMPQQANFNLRHNHMKIGFLFFPILFVCHQVQSQRLIRFYDNYKAGYKNFEGEIVIEPTFEFASEFQNGYAIFLQGNKRGYINETGKVVINPQFQDAYLFNNGVAAVKTNNAYGFIKPDGTWFIEPFYENAFSYKENLARVCLNKKWGFINLNNKQVIPFQYDYVGDFHEGLAKFMLGGQWGFINKKNEVIIEAKYLFVTDFKDGKSQARTNNKEVFIIDALGNSLETLNRKESEHEGLELRKKHYEFEK
jgi:hypothetical protein